MLVWNTQRNISPATLSKEEISAAYRRTNAAIWQAMVNNLWDNNLGELDRWENEGGPPAAGKPK